MGPLAMLLALLLAAVPAPTGLSVTLRAASLTRYKAQFAWKYPAASTPTTFAYWVLARDGRTRLAEGTTTAKSKTLTLPRTDSAGDQHKLCVQVSNAGTVTCVWKPVPQVDSGRVKLFSTADGAYATGVRSLNPDALGDFPMWACAYIWIRGKVLRDATGVRVIGPAVSASTPVTTAANCLARLPSSRIWPAP